MDLGGADMYSVQYQNANNSVRVSDEFMRAVVDGTGFELRARLDNRVLETVDARELFRTIAQAAWECADPGLQYDDTINDWHTCPDSGRITASNPCFTGDTHVHTDKGLIRFDDLVDRARRGEAFGVYTHDATNPDTPASRVEVTTPEAIMVTGTNEILRLEFSNGMVLRCTPNHGIWTVNRGYVEAQHLTAEDQILQLDLPTPAFGTSYEFRLAPGTPVAAGQIVPVENRRQVATNLPEKWDGEFAHMLGWLVGDGCLRLGRPGVRGNAGEITLVYGDEDRAPFLARHRATLTGIMGLSPKPSEQPNGTVQLRCHRRPLVNFMIGLGVVSEHASGKRIPKAVLEAPTEIQASFLRGLFDADGCTADMNNGTRYVGLGSVSVELLRDVQRMLTCFGITSRIYSTRGSNERSTFTYTTVGGEERSYKSELLYDLRISGENVPRFAAAVGFDHPRKQRTLQSWLESRTFYRTDQTIRMVGREPDGFETTYNLSEPRNHSYIASGIVVRNCSEYVHLDNSSCNLASLNLMKFLREDRTFDIDSFVAAVELIITAMDISICFADFPTPEITRVTRAYRQLGIGYANLGAMLMATAHAYDSEGGRAVAAAITSLMSAVSYRRSAELAGIVGAYDGFAPNAQAHRRVVRKHAAANDAVRTVGAEDARILAAAGEQWQQALAEGERHGWRNAQVSLLAPTGTIGLAMDCDTTGIEPDLALVKMKKLVGGASMKIVNRTVPAALRCLGYAEETVEAIVEYIAEHGHVVDAPGLRREHYEVFDCAIGDRVISPIGHVRMMAAVQPLLSGAISKTCNMPETATVEDIEHIYLEGWRLGLKAIAVYRDNCKVGQPLSAMKKADKEAADPMGAGDGGAAGSAQSVVEYRPIRRRLPKTRPSQTVSFSVGGAEGYMTAGSYPDDGLGEVFIKMSKQGSTLAGVMDAFSIAISIALQHGVPLETYVSKFINMRFEPAGMTDDPDVRIAQSIMDYLFRRLALDYLDEDKRAELGIFTASERARHVAGAHGVALPPATDDTDIDIDSLRSSAPVEHAHGTAEPAGKAPGSPAGASGAAGTGVAGGSSGAAGADGARPASAAPAAERRGAELATAAPGEWLTARTAVDAPLCFTCGVTMRSAGSCYVCEHCGTTSGCS
jgi:ribonucleoside-diphosphate reductase alpha chain